MGCVHGSARIARPLAAHRIPLSCPRQVGTIGMQSREPQAQLKISSSEVRRAGFPEA
jgi:hypothetical protein